VSKGGFCSLVKNWIIRVTRGVDGYKDRMQELILQRVNVEEIHMEDQSKGERLS
jgi:hypothetical protein